METTFRGSNLAVVEDDETVYLLQENQSTDVDSYSFTVLENSPEIDYNPIERNVLLSEDRASEFETYDEVVDAVLEKYGVDNQDTNQNLINSELEELQV